MADASSSSPAPGSSSSSSSSSDPSAASTTSSSSSSSPSSPFATAAGAGVAAALDWEHFRTHGHELVDFIVDYYKSVEARPVKSPVAPGYLRPQLPDHAPESAEPFSAVLADIESKIMPGVTHWQHPGFFAYFPANSSPPGLLGEMLSGMFNVIGFSWIASPAASELETVVLDWLAKLIGLPEVFLSQGTGGGVIQGTASEATLVALLAAKARALAAPRARAEETDDSLVSKFVVYTSDQAHSSIKKACMVAGIHLDRFRSLPAHGPDFRFDPEALATAIRDDQAAGLVPLFCCATLGTTSSGAFDPIDRIGRLCREHGLWFHVDAAWAGSAFVCPEFQHLHAGIEFADSFDFNPHKWCVPKRERCERAGDVGVGEREGRKREGRRRWRDRGAGEMRGREHERGGQEPVVEPEKPSEIRRRSEGDFGQIRRIDIFPSSSSSPLSLCIPFISFPPPRPLRFPSSLFLLLLPTSFPGPGC